MSKIVKNSKQATKRRETVYILDFRANKIKTKTEIEKDFCRAPEEFRWDFCNSVDEYIFRMERAGEYVVVKNNGYIVSNKILTPKQYGDALNMRIPADITLAQFDEITDNKYGIWNYPLFEYKHIVENNLKVVLVRFKNGEHRFVEVR
jgi:hypothetical protein